MTNSQNTLPQLNGTMLLTDSGLETTLIFHDGIDLPCFAAYPLMNTPDGRAVLHDYYARHLAIASERKAGFLLESPTWRASRDWGAQLGHGPEDLARFNRDAIAMLAGLRRTAIGADPIVISGNIGPRGDGYRADTAMTADEAQHYHAEQIGWFAETEVDLVTAVTLSTVAEAAGVIRAAAQAGLSAVVSFTTETDGCLPDGTELGHAITQTDDLTDGAAAYFMVNCAHPDHFRPALEVGSDWLTRIVGIRANASRMSHAELDDAAELDPGDPVELGHDYRDLRQILPNLTVIGGCCGTDHRHIDAMAECCLGHAAV